MYDKALAAAIPAAGVLTTTGLNLIYIVLAGFAMIAAGAAILRILPSLHR
jgi:phage-related minor tail protein